MVNLHITTALMVAAGLSCACAAGQQVNPGYDPVAAFAPLPHPPATPQRTAAGMPGPKYWNNIADYKINVAIDTVTRGVQGRLTVIYTNNSPDSLSFLWLSSIHNRYKKDSRETLLSPPGASRFGIVEHTDGLLIDAVSVGKRPAAWHMFDNFVRVDLEKPLLPGEQVRLEMAYRLTLPYNGSDYMGVLKTPHGQVFQYTAVFPRMCVYDDLRGWNTLQSQYYVESGSIDMSFTAPANMIVQGTGQLMNPQEVMRPSVLKRYREAVKSDTLRNILSAGEPFAPEGAATLTWRFFDPRAGDGIWAASASFKWEGLGLRLPSGRTLPAVTLYPPGSHKEWDTLGRSIPVMLKTYTEKWTDYPYSAMTTMAGSLNGIASPGVTIIHYTANNPGFTIPAKANHEVGHAWFNLAIAGDSKAGWMCEGLNTFINYLNAYKLGLPEPYEMATAMQWLAQPSKRVPLNVSSGSIPPNETGKIAYMKPALALLALRNEVIGPERFDDAFRRYMAAWVFRHPSPTDFFRAMDNAAGEDLSWFWRAWFLTDARLDQAVEKVAYDGKTPEKGILITIRNRQMMPMPVNLQVWEANGKSHWVRLPARVWESGDTHLLKVATTTPVLTVTIDPQHRLADEDRTNNIWTGKGTKLNPSAITATQVIDRYIEAIGGRSQAEKLHELHLEYRNATDSNLVVRQWYGLSDTYSWASAIENSMANVPLKNLRQDGKLKYTNIGLPVTLPPAGREAVRFDAHLLPELYITEMGAKLELSDSLHLVHGMETYLVQLSSGTGNKWNLYFDRETGLKVRQEFLGDGKDMLYVKKVLGGYITIQGVRIPSVVIYNEDGSRYEAYELKHFSNS